jgi:DNA-binding MarR family transcriptional regulator
MEGRFLGEITDHNVSFVQMNLLRVLHEHPGKTVGDVTKYMYVSYPAATKTIDKLAKLGYVKRKEDPGDRRIAHLHLTSAGEALVDEYERKKEQKIKHVIDRFGLGNAKELNGKLLEFARALLEEFSTDPSTCMHCGAFDPEFCLDSRDDCGYLVQMEKENLTPQ